MKKIGSIIALLAGVLLAGQAFAQAPGQSYFGASFGAVWTDGGSPYTINVVNEDVSVGFKAFAGNMLWNKFGLEVGYYYLGTYETEFTGSGQPFMEAQTSAIAVNGVYTTPLGPGYAFHAKVGLAFTLYEASCRDAAVCAASVPVMLNTKNYGVSGMLGIGISANLAKDLALRMDFEHIGSVHQAVGNTDFKDGYDIFSVGIQFTF
ncbi:MAG: outer membrane beta-barrel protein [Burkholderiales bacterium]